MIILGIDPGYAIVGWGIVRYAGGRYQPLDFGAITTRAGVPFNRRLEIIYDELTASNDQLLARIRFLATKNQADKLVATMANFRHRTSENATASYNRWRDSADKGGASGQIIK